MMDCHRVISYSGRCLLAVDCRLHKIAHEGDLFRPAYFLRNLFYLYDTVATINLTKHEIIELTQPQLRSGLHKLPLGQALAEYAEQFFLRPGALVIFWTDTQFSPHACGQPEFILPRGAFESLLRPEYASW